MFFIGYNGVVLSLKKWLFGPEVENVILSLLVGCGRGGVVRAMAGSSGLYICVCARMVFLGHVVIAQRKPEFF